MYIDINIILVLLGLMKVIWWSVVITWLLCKRKKIAKIIKKMIKS